MNARRGRSRLLIVLLSCLLLLIAGVLSVWLMAPPVPLVPPPSPNAAETLAAASQVFQGMDQIAQVETAMETWDDVELLRTLQDANAATFDLIDQACGQACVPLVDYDKGFSDGNLNDPVSQFRTAAYLPRIAGRLATLEGRHQDAATYYADLFVLSTKYGTHGLLLHAQVCMAMERLALQQLLTVADSLDEQAKADLRQRIESGRHQAFDYDAMAARERLLANNEHGVAQATYMRFMTRGTPNQSRWKTEEVEAEVVRLQAELLEKLSGEADTAN